MCPSINKVAVLLDRARTDGWIKSKHEEMLPNPLMWDSRPACSILEQKHESVYQHFRLILPKIPLSKRNFNLLDLVTVIYGVPQTQTLQLFQQVHGCEMSLCLFFNLRELWLTEVQAFSWGHLWVRATLNFDTKHFCYIKKCFLIIPRAYFNSSHSAITCEPHFLSPREKGSRASYYTKYWTLMAHPVWLHFVLRFCVLFCLKVDTLVPERAS